MSFAYNISCYFSAGNKDTAKAELQKVTFKPILKTFEEEILEKMNIKDDRKPASTYWY